MAENCQHLWVVDAWGYSDFEWSGDQRVILDWVATLYRCQYCQKRVERKEVEEAQGD